MSSNARSAGPRLLPVMQYRDLGRAIAWLGRAFGFEQHHIVRSEDGTIQYAVVSHANALIMLGPVRGAELVGLMKQPDETGGAETQSCYLIVDDAEAHYARARAAGATIVFDLKSYDYGGRGYSCRDPEGHIWTFGTYDPWQAATGRTVARRTLPLVPALVAVLVAIAAAGWLTAAGLVGAAIETPASRGPSPQASADQQQAAAELDRVRAQREFAESALGEASKQAAAEREARKRAELARDEVAKLAAAEREARQRFEQARDEVSKHVSVEREARQRAERVLGELTKQAAVEHEARQRAERVAQDAQAQGERQRDAREAAERRLQQLQRELERQRRTLKTLQEQLRAEVRAKEEAARAAQAAQKRLAELEAMKGEATRPAQGTSPPASPVQKETSNPKPSQNVTREGADPMPALVP
jgi:uncharacterized glyoxalase superfamily protein PhnB